jgi:hypothetical protein
MSLRLRLLVSILLGLFASLSLGSALSAIGFAKSCWRGGSPGPPLLRLKQARLTSPSAFVCTGRPTCRAAQS